MSTPVNAQDKPIVPSHVESSNSSTHARKIQSGSPDDTYNSGEDQVLFSEMPPERHKTLEVYDDFRPQRQSPWRYDQETTGQLGPMHARRSSEEETHEETGQKRKFSADDNDNVRAAKQRKVKAAETTIKLCEHTSDNADVKKEIDETSEEVLVPQKNTQSVQMTKEDTKVKDKGKMRAYAKITRSTTEEENNTAAEAAAPTTEVGQNETIGQKRKLGADDDENVRPAKQTKGKTTETTIQPCEHTSDDADVKKEIDEASEEMLAPQKNVLSVETTKGKPKRKDKGKMRACTKMTLSTTEEIDDATIDAAAPTTELQGIGQKRKSSADDNDNVRAAKQRKGKMADTTPKPFNHTPDNADVKKETDEASEEVLAPQKNVQFVETIKEKVKGKKKKKKRTEKVRVRWAPDLSTIIEEDDEAEAEAEAEAAAAEAAAPTTELERRLIAEEARLQREIAFLHQNVQHLPGNYRVVAKLGEGKYSTVYKAKDLQHDRLDNTTWKQQLLASWELTASAFESMDTKPEIATRYVALKRIYANTSPARAAQEINIMKSLSGCPCVAPLITAFREKADFFIVTPYFEHDDFLEYFMDMTMEDIKCYLYSLLTALNHLHSHGFVHRDIKPDNFLYNRQLRTGVLIDFGLSEPIPEISKEEYERRRLAIRRRLGLDREETAVTPGTKERVNRPPGYLENDFRYPVLANITGTRGFKSPEVLLREPVQTEAADIWSVGMILLSLLSGRLPWPVDDADALVDIATLLGLDEMKTFADKLNRTFDTNIETIPRQPESLYNICRSFNEEKLNSWEEEDVNKAIDLLQKCLVLDRYERITAENALKHPFFDVFNNNIPKGQ